MGRKRITTTGFTLIELMVTLSVAGVILAFAAPNFREFLLNSRMTGSANDLLTSLQLARSEAIKRQRPVAVCPSLNPLATPPTCRADAVWSDGAAQAGLVLWEDTNGDASPAAGEPVIAPQELLGPSLTVRSNFNAVVYQPNGFADVPGNPAARVVLICDERINSRVGDNYRKRVLSVNRTGRAEILKDIAAVDLLEGVAFGDTGNCP
ncbi:MAG TPA: GspH/FimT family pseudopilin [Steroidobacteraceae bacterium]|nr:GspH/FimT family pseudopilin [Steroidobacteraceae bacterium]